MSREAPRGGDKPIREMSRREAIVAESIRTIIDAFGVADMKELEVGDGENWYQIKAVDAIGNIQKRGFRYTILIDGLETRFRKADPEGGYIIKTAVELFPRVAAEKAAVEQAIAAKAKKQRGTTPVMGDFSRRGAQNVLVESRRKHLQEIENRLNTILSDNKVNSVTDLEVKFGKTGQWRKIEYFNKITGELTVAGGSLLPRPRVMPRGQAMGRSDKVNILSTELEFKPLEK